MNTHECHLSEEAIQELAVRIARAQRMGSSNPVKDIPVFTVSKGGGNRGTEGDSNWPVSTEAAADELAQIAERLSVIADASRSAVASDVLVSLGQSGDVVAEVFKRELVGGAYSHRGRQRAPGRHEHGSPGLVVALAGVEDERLGVAGADDLRDEGVNPRDGDGVAVLEFDSVNGYFAKHDVSPSVAGSDAVTSDAAKSTVGDATDVRSPLGTSVAPSGGDSA